MFIHQQDAGYDRCLANEKRFYEINSKYYKSSSRDIPEYAFFNRFAAICYLLAGSFGVALQVLLYFCIILRFLG
jgi:hypothetical protein